MAHFAEINQNFIVTRVLVIDNSLENIGQEFLSDNLALGGTWIQTSYNANFRKNFAAIDYIYDVERDAFIPPKPFSSWILEEQTCQWKSPVKKPDDGKIYVWNEESLSWIEA